MRVFISTSFALFLCINLSLGQKRNIIINEFMFDPVPASGLPEVEYVEILNITDEHIQLSGWNLNGYSIPEVTLMAGQFLVLCKSSEVQLFNQSIIAMGMNSWDILNNTGQAIILTDGNSNTVDSLSYDNSWIYDKEKSEGGWSLELINPFKPCTGKDNWAVSENLKGGTPGFNNSVFDISPDTTPPEIIRSETLDDHSLQIWFNEAVNFKDIIFSTSFELIDENFMLDAAFYGFSEIQRITFSEPMNKGKVYQMKVKGLMDCSGNSIQDTIIYFGLGIEPGFNDILITEILADEIPPIGLPESEYIEILNATEKLISFKNSFIYTNSELYELPDRNLLPGKYYILVPGSKFELFGNYPNVMLMDRFPRLNNDGKELAIYNRNNGAIFSLSYNKKWYKFNDKSEGGYSIEMIDIRNPCGDINNWTASVSDNGGTPGEINSVSSDNPDLSGPMVLTAHALEKESITVIFNEKLHAGCFQDLEVFVNNHDMAGLWTYDTIVFNSLEILLPDEPATTLKYELNLNGIKDCVGNFMEEKANTFQVTVPGDPIPGDVAINEIMFNSKPGGIDWIEIYNRSEKHLDLKDWYLSKEKYPLDDQKYTITKDHIIIKPYSFRVFTSNIDKVIYDFPNTERLNCLEIRNLPGLPDKDGYISIWAPEEIKLETVYYSDEQHNLFLQETEGVSLERISPDIPANDHANWHSASSDSGFGTPTRINSQFSKTGTKANQIGIFPKVISPDQDGFDDRLHISIINQKPGYITNIYIYNVRGALIKTLVKGRLLGTDEDISWDGFIDNGSIADPGHYILLLELFHPDGDMFMEKRNFVVARKF